MTEISPELDGMTDVVVTGLGAVSALGVGCGALWRGVDQGRCGLREIQRFDTGELTVSIGGLVPGYDRDRRDISELCLELALLAAREALDEAGAFRDEIPSHRLALIVGASMGEGGRDPTRLARQLGAELEVEGPRLTVSTACASSVNAIGLGRDLLSSGEADLVLAGGADGLTPELMAGFHALGALSREPCAPFSVPYGTTLSEGAGFLVLERREQARRRGARPRAVILGYGLSGDAFHETMPHPRGAGVALALRGALTHAGLGPSDVGYVNAHGTGTVANDGAEWKALREVFGPRAETLPVSSTKGHLGHAQGAAGALETITTILALERGCVPPTLNFTRPRRPAPADPVARSTPREQEVRFAICTNSAFGGANCAVVLGRPEAGAARELSARPIYVRGLGFVGAGATSPFISSTSTGAEDAGRSRPLGIDITRFLRHADPRGLDPSAVDLTCAAQLALNDAGVVPRGDLRGRTGLCVGMCRTSPQSVHEFADSLERRGLARVSTTAFARLVLNASQGSCAKLLSIMGPQTTLAAGSASGLVAVAHAAHLLATRDDADLMIAGAVDEPDFEAADGEVEGAACLILSREAPGAGPAIRLAGWALAGPADPDRAVGIALDRAGRAAKEEEITRVSPGPGALPAIADAVASADGLRRVPGGGRRVAVVVASGGGAASCALVFVREER